MVLLRILAVLANLVFGLLAFDDFYRSSQPSPIVVPLMVASILNLIVILSPGSIFGWGSTYLRRKQLEEQKKIDALNHDKPHPRP